MKCEHWREQILQYLYDLLESAEKDELTAHLEKCAACQDALKAAEDQKGMLAEAVKAQNSDITFKAPVKATPASATAPLFTQPPAPARRLFLFNRWVMAASLLFVLFTLGFGFGGAAWRDQRDAEADAKNRLAKARLDLEKAQTDLTERKDHTHKEIRAIQKQIDEIFTNWKKDEEI